ncbi:MAG: hypothetical protein ABI662_01460, partial [Dermatophilaceae bacterium]
MRPRKLPKDNGQSVALAGDRARTTPVLGRKSLLVGMLTSGLVIANAAQSPDATAATTTQDLMIVPPNADGSYTRPAVGTPVYLGLRSMPNLPWDWAYCLSTASRLDTPAMGTLKVLGAPSNAWEVEYQGLPPVVADDGTVTCAAPAGATAYRSEVIFTSDRTDAANNYTTFRFVEGQRIRLAFDVMN